MRDRRFLVIVTVLLLLCGRSASAQFRDGEAGGAKLGQSQVQKLRTGVVVNAVSGPCRGIVAYLPLPIDWPEQQVKVIDEEVTPTAKVGYRMVDDTVKLMVVNISFLPAGQKAEATVTYEIRRSTLLLPDDTSGYVLPERRKISRKVQLYLAPSPMIESRNPKIRRLAKEIVGDTQGAWQQVEAIYDWVREHVDYKNGPLKGALAALQDGDGDCEELTSLFIALCRASEIPARTVWVEGHCYPEFYLLDAEGTGHWFPCQAAGTRAFGEIPELRPILSKGDNFRPPWNRRDRQRYPRQYLTGTGGKPRVTWIREPLSD